MAVVVQELPGDLVAGLGHARLRDSDRGGGDLQPQHAQPAQHAVVDEHEPGQRLVQRRRGDRTGRLRSDRGERGQLRGLRVLLWPGGRRVDGHVDARLQPRGRQADGQRAGDRRRPWWRPAAGRGVDPAHPEHGRLRDALRRQPGHGLRLPRELAARRRQLQHGGHQPGSVDHAGRRRHDARRWPLHDLQGRQRQRGRDQPGFEPRPGSACDDAAGG